MTPQQVLSTIRKNKGRFCIHISGKFKMATITTATLHRLGPYVNASFVKAVFAYDDAPTVKNAITIYDVDTETGQITSSYEETFLTRKQAVAHFHDNAIQKIKQHQQAIRDLIDQLRHAPAN